MEAFRQMVNKVRSGPRCLESFDEILFAGLVEKITAESRTCVRFCLCGGIELTEQIREGEK